ncbi:SAM-dependent methyltransferase [Phycisphaerales bacterium AB-hyl4]|uniref:SAM-dependent methyltransferase n=1 Tax=Natronomicrosphaera hydrolytica TaxID=3242702 RepID=A0ABV4UB95_9BACT
MADETCPYVSRGGLKLAAALDAFGIDPTGYVCADLGCSTGGFTDCLLQRGAARVYAVDTAYGELAWKLRQDERVDVRERTNALHFDPWAEVAGFQGCDLVVLDLGWTVQARAVPAAMRWLRREADANATGEIVSLIKPHYEASGQAMGSRGGGRGGRGGVLDEAAAERVLGEVLEAMPTMGVRSRGHVMSPIRGGKGGNIEYLAYLELVGRDS